MLHGPSMIRVGNTAYIDLDMSDLNGPVAAEVTGKLFILNIHKIRFYQIQFIFLYNTSLFFRFRSGRNNHSLHFNKVIVQFISHRS